MKKWERELLFELLKSYASVFGNHEISVMTDTDVKFGKSTWFGKSFYKKELQFTEIAAILKQTVPEFENIRITGNNDMDISKVLTAYLAIPKDDTKLKKNIHKNDISREVSELEAWLDNALHESDTININVS